MAKDGDIKKTLGDTEFGSSMKDLADGDMARGYFNAEPTSDYERSLEPKPKYAWPMDDDDDGDVGFLHRPEYKGDVER